MNDEMILSPEMDEELSNGKGEDENECFCTGRFHGH